MNPLKKIKHIHFVGIGGAGMIGIAYLLLRKGYKVSGSDINKSKSLGNLKKIGAKVFYTHNERNVGKADLIVTSSAIKTSNPEYRIAKRKGITIIPRAQMLGSLMRGYESIAIAGSHGKTTTTSMIANIFSEALLSPTYIVGGKVLGIGKNSELGSGNHLIAEADESDGSLHLQPDVGVFTNIDNDHLSYYDNDIEKLLNSFQMFAENIPFYGALIINIDDKNVREVAKKISRRQISFGFSPKSDYQVTNASYKNNYQIFNLVNNILNKKYLFSLPMPGKHNLYNAAAAIAASLEEGIPIKSIQKGLKNFKGVSRRFEKHELIIKKKNLTLIDDYGHHPEEIRSTINAIHQAFPKKKICMIFQPHRYTRTAQLYDDFKDVLSLPDSLLLFDIYPASEAPIKGISSKKLLESIKQDGHLNAKLTSNKSILDDIKNSYMDFDILVSQGAGSISSVCEIIKRNGRNKSIVVLYGGASSERDISLESGKGIYEAIDQLGYFVKLKDYNNLEKLEDLKKYDLVFIALHGFEGESGILQKNLDNLGILYTGSKYLSCKNTWNKSKFKDILESALIPTPRGFSVERIHSNMQSPFHKFHKEYNEEIKNLFLKPEEDGSSVDIFEVNCESDLEIAIRDAQNPNRAFIFEESIKFKEFTVSILDNKCLPIIEIKTTNNFYDYDAKYISDTTQLIEADLDEKNKNKIHDMALNAFKELGCVKWGRVDILQDKNQHLYILEINTVPGMTSHSCLPRAAEISGISYKELVQIIIEDAHL